MTNVRLMRPVHRALMFGALVAGATLATRGVLLAHAMLLSSDPKAGSELTRSPQQVRLVFSEAIDASVSGIRLVPPRNAPLDLAVIADPRDAKALVAPLAPLAVGMYRVVWRTVSVDGHAVNGSFGFTVRGDSTMAPATIPPVVPPLLQPDTLSVAAPNPVPVVPGLLRGSPLCSLLSLSALLFFS